MSETTYRAAPPVAWRLSHVPLEIARECELVPELHQVRYLLEGVALSYEGQAAPDDKTVNQLLGGDSCVGGKVAGKTLA